MGGVGGNVGMEWHLSDDFNLRENYWKINFRCLKTLFKLKRNFEAFVEWELKKLIYNFNARKTFSFVNEFCVVLDLPPAEIPFFYFCPCDTFFTRGNE